MKFKILLVISCFVLIFASAVAQIKDQEATEKAQQLLSKSASILFIENKGQIKDTKGNFRPDILFTAEASGITYYFTNKGVSYVMHKVEKRISDNADENLKKKVKNPLTIKPYRMDMEFLGSNENVQILPNDDAETYYNYFVNGSDITGVKTYKKLTFKGLFPNIDFVFYGNGNHLKYDIIVNPGGNLSDLKLKYKGADAVFLESGNLSIATPLGKLQESIPESYQFIKTIDISNPNANISFAEKKILNCNYVVNNNIVTFNIDTYDKTLPLVIDPTLRWSTYLGGENDETTGYECFDAGSIYTQGGIATDSLDSIIVVGSTKSYDFPADMGTYSLSGSWDVFVFKLDPTGTTRIWGLFKGGNYDDCATDVAVDTSNNIWVVGGSQSPGLFTGAYIQPTCVSCPTYSDGFIMKINPGGNVIRQTFIGDTLTDVLRGISIGADNKPVVVGESYSNNLPTIINANWSYQTTCASCPTDPDAIVAKFNNNLSSVSWGTYHGGEGEEFGLGIATIKNPTNDIIIVGETKSPYSTLYTAQPLFNGRLNQDTTNNNLNKDGFIAIFKGNILINPTAPYFSTYYGGTEDDYITGVAQTSDTVLFNICGYTESDTNSQKFPLQILAGPYITYGGNGDGFVAGLLKKLPVQTGYPGYNNQWAVYCGGSGYDRVNDIAFDKNDVTINITGETNSSDFPIKHAFQNQIVNLFDAFAAKYFAPVGHKLWSTYFGGEDFECGIGVTTTDSNGVVISGTALDGLLTTPWAYQPDYAGNGYDRDAFVAKFSNLTALPTYVGGELDDFIEDMFVDQEGYIYITGITYSSDFPVLDGYDESYNGDGDIFITKFNNIGFKMFSTFYGGDSTDHGMAIVKDYYNEQSDLYVTGYTKSSSGIGYTGSGDPLSTTYNYLEDGFLLKISNDGMTRRWCTYLAGGYRDFCTGVCLNNDESNIYVTGYTQSPYFDPYSPTINLNNHYSLFVYINYDAFVTKFDTDGAGIWNEFIGGDEDDFSNDIDYVRNLDQVAIVGSTNSQYGFPLMNETKDQTGYIIGKAPNPVSFVGVIDEEGNNIFCSHYGGSVNSNYALAVYSSNDETNNTFFVGYTSDGVSENFPYNNQDGYQQVYGGGEFDGFVATLLTDQDDNWQTIDGSFLGGDSVDFANEISGKGDDIYIVGQTGFRWYNYLPSGSFPYAKYPYISGNYSDAFLIKMNKDLSELNMGTYYGANKLDVANAVGLDPLGNPIVAGVSYYDAGSDIHDIDYWAEQPTRGGECDGFLVKFNRGGLYFAKESVHENEITNEYLNLLLYPNPSIQNITIQLKMHESSNVLFEITNLLGEKVFSKSSPCSTIDYNETIDIHSLSSGVYCLTVTNKDKKRSKMFIKE